MSKGALNSFINGRLLADGVGGAQEVQHVFLAPCFVITLIEQCGQRGSPAECTVAELPTPLRVIFVRLGRARKRVQLPKRGETHEDVN